MDTSNIDSWENEGGSIIPQHIRISELPSTVHRIKGPPSGRYKDGVGPAAKSYGQVKAELNKHNSEVLSSKDI